MRKIFLYIYDSNLGKVRLLLRGKFVAYILVITSDFHLFFNILAEPHKTRRDDFQSLKRKQFFNYKYRAKL